MIIKRSHLVFVILISVCFSVTAIDLHDLQTQGLVKVDIQRQTTDEIIVNQPIIFEVKVSSIFGFNKGSNFKSPSVKNTVILPTKSLSMNGRETNSGKTWITQTREIVIYPLEVGSYLLPQVDVTVSVKGPNNAPVSGNLLTEQVDFIVSKPTELNSINNYVVTKELELSVIDSPDKTEYSLGEAFTREIIISADNVPAMMLPELVIKKIEGLSIYQKPAILNDKSNRGFLTGIKTYNITYIIEKPGVFEIPEQKIIWWDLQQKMIKTRVIDKKSWSVDAINSKTPVSNNNIDRPNLNIIFIFETVMVLICIGIILFLYFRNRVSLIKLFTKITHQEYRKYRRHFLDAVHNKEYHKACNYLYLIVNSLKKQGLSKHKVNSNTLHQHYRNNPNQIITLNKLLENAYKNTCHEICAQEAKNLLKNNENKKSVKYDLLLINPNK